MTTGNQKLNDDIEGIDDLLKEIRGESKEPPKLEEEKETPAVIPQKEGQEEEPDELDKLIDEKFAEEPASEDLLSEDKKAGGAFSPDEIQKQLEAIKQENQQLNTKVTDADRIQKEHTALQENNLKIALIDKDLIELNNHAGQIIAYKKELEDQLESKAITAQQYAEEIQKIAQISINVKQKADFLKKQREVLPTVEQYQQRQQIKQKNDEYFVNYSKEIKDDLLKKHVEKLKKNHYDAWGQPLENNPTFKSNSDWIQEIIKDARAQGYQQAIERISERKAKGKLSIKGSAQGVIPKQISTIKADDALKLPDADFAKWLEA